MIQRGHILRWPASLLLMVIGLTLAGGVGLMIGIAMIGFGTIVYVRIADRDKPEGSLSGTLRGVSHRGFAHALPWDACGAIIVLWVAFRG